MQIDLTKEVDKDLPIRECLIISLDRLWGKPVRTQEEAKGIANLKYHIIDSDIKDRPTFEISDIEFKYCVNAIRLSDYSAKIKLALLGGLSDHTN